MKRSAMGTLDRLDMSGFFPVSKSLSRTYTEAEYRRVIGELERANERSREDYVGRLERQLESQRARLIGELEQSRQSAEQLRQELSQYQALEKELTRAKEMLKGTQYATDLGWEKPEENGDPSRTRKLDID